MSNKVFVTMIAILIVGSVGLVALSKKRNPAPERPGIAHEDKGRKHVADGTIKNDTPEPPTSGDHYSSPLPWRAYDQEIPDGSAIHNLEHGGVYVSYRPDVPSDQISKIRALFTEPFSRQNFSPTKVIVAPRAANDSPIIMSSWTRSMKLEAFDEEKMVEFYLRNVGKSPEASAN